QFVPGELDGEQGGEFLPGGGLDLIVDAIAVAVHRHDDGEIPDADDPHRLGHAELQLQHILDLFDGLGDERSGAADGVEVNGGLLDTGLQRPGAHAALANHALEVKVADDVGLVDLFADARGRPGGDE